MSGAEIDRRALGLASIERARAAGKTIGRPRSGRDDEVRRLLDAGLSWARVAKKLGVGRNMVARVARESEGVFRG